MLDILFFFSNVNINGCLIVLNSNHVSHAYKLNSAQKRFSNVIIYRPFRNQQNKLHLRVQRRVQLLDSCISLNSLFFNNNNITTVMFRWNKFHSYCSVIFTNKGRRGSFSELAISKSNLSMSRRCKLTF